MLSKKIWNVKLKDRNRYPGKHKLKESCDDNLISENIKFMINIYIYNKN